MNLTELKTLIKTESTRAYNLKTKKARSKAWDKVRDLERQALNILYAQRDIYSTQSMKCTVRHFTDGDEHFLVESPYGSLWLSPTSDAVSKSWYSHTCCVQYTKGQTIIVEFEIDVSDRLSLEIIPKRIHGGTLNETKYAELCQRGNLAFFKYPDGHMSGLFASKKEEQGA